MNVIDGSIIKIENLYSSLVEPSFSNDILIGIETYKGNLYVVSVNPSDQIQSIISDVNESIDYGSPRFSTDRHYIDDLKTFKDYNIKNGSSLYFHMHFNCKSSLPFSDVSREGHNLKWDKTAPKWRIAKKGLCLEGKCTNSDCDAFNQMVLINMGEICIFRLGLDKTRQRTNCPICYEHVKPVTCGFNNCEYRYISIKETNEATVNEKSNWKRIGDNYYRFEENQSANYIKLLIEVRKLDRYDSDDKPSSLTKPVECYYCLAPSGNTYFNTIMVKFEECEHEYHQKCSAQFNDSKSHAVFLQCD